jgi:hypothetical protein
MPRPALPRPALPPLLRGPEPRAQASCRCPSAGPRCVRHALLARLPLGLHLALDLSPIDLRWRALFDPLHAELEEAPLPGLAVRRIGHFRPFPNDLRARSRIFQTPKDFTFFTFWNYLGSKIFWSPTVCKTLNPKPENLKSKKP